MLTRSSSLIQKINNSDPLKILTAPTHERTQSNWGRLGHHFYLLQKEGTIKPWVNKYAKLPNNHTLLPRSNTPITQDMTFDICLSQNKFGQIQIFKPYCDQFNLPLISF